MDVRQKKIQTKYINFCVSSTNFKKYEKWVTTGIHSKI
jgi:hypothetical protein